MMLPSRKVELTSITCIIEMETVKQKMVFSHGVTGGKGRCYPLWQDLMYCMARVGALHGEKCTLEFDDYLECLHHTKLKRRIAAIRAEKQRQEKEST
ncbi:NADH dehydrogenase [ubiquinone] iron-sulfur protein 5-A [Trichoplax sp. H2]|nr:NADH dehydrogenase [ubiquinone] iron-sulfur protein 5-A [Trichoplax sp. H2]|eukprot:RDD47859.1 NADH dehydrogenase [ubiquinone] iron-sulfur protein 5-A [Trichoplax sp. H2]